MKVVNLTDFPTATLENYGMRNQSISVGGSLLEPGDTLSIAPEQEAVVRADLEHFLTIGAVAIDTHPPDYPLPGTWRAPGRSVPLDAPPPEPPATSLTSPGHAPSTTDVTLTEPVEPRKSRKKE